jgi:hypothetical protein
MIEALMAIKIVSGRYKMSGKALATAKVSTQSLQKSKPRYTEEENQKLFESWWNPQQRRELVNHLGRNMSALRSQFCRLLKEKGLSNQEYYNMMQSKYTGDSGVAPRKRSREIKDVDRLILEVFAKHQALGNSRTAACDELQQKLGKSFSTAALKLRFYRLIKRFNYKDEDLVALGKEVLGEKPAINEAEAVPVVERIKPKTVSPEPSPISIDKVRPAQNQASTSNADNIFFQQLSSLPEIIKNFEERLNKIEAQQRHQLDLRGFVEHLLAVERDLKREDKLMEEIQKLMDENDKLQSLIGREQDRLKKREQELAEVYKMLDTMLSDYMRLESVSKLASLGDFMHRLEITVDQFGNVLKSRRINADI